jgi:hypothetical protein
MHHGCHRRLVQPKQLINTDVQMQTRVLVLEIGMVVCVVLCMSHLGIEACMESVARRVHVSGFGPTAKHLGIE